MLTEVTAYPGDLILHMSNPLYCLTEAIIRNATGASVMIEDVVGFPLKLGDNGADYKLAKAGDEANVIALLVAGPNGRASETLANNTNSPTKWTVLKNAPCIINQNKIRTTDFAGDAFTIATIVTALKALKWEVREECEKEETMD